MCNSFLSDYNLKKSLWIFLIAIYRNNLSAGQSSVIQGYSFIIPESYVQSKNFCQLTFLDILPDINEIIANDRLLPKITNEKR
jgi:hypothetical protein